MGRQTHSRGVVGWIAYAIYLAFNLAMLLLVARMLMIVHPNLSNGGGIGGSVAIFAVMLFWALGAFILGLLAKVTRR